MRHWQANKKNVAKPKLLKQLVIFLELIHEMQLNYTKCVSSIRDFYFCFFELLKVTDFSCSYDKNDAAVNRHL